ncbi:hypothetical protein AURDEDRAFT_170701 [Auricularia subglabra TFB-10046 SS5]|uniref:Gfd2/YDR514C-like C-terminal domain-containing protein n=1 Tax=Auricularia subglabra (strain TFB-10046 / SS5) TaxID=717982 RepID=J0WXS8_AURST|nr:hypothetical protein AURDEDRAFT_170701 [Auricularia subglabra TFB-10046 SS5]
MHFHHFSFFVLDVQLERWSKVTYREDYLDVQACIPCALPLNQRRPRSENPFAGRYASAYPSWRIKAQIDRVCEELSLNTLNPSRSRTSQIDGHVYDITCWDVIEAFGVPPGTWNALKGRFEKVDLVAELVHREGNTPEHQELLCRLSFFLDDVRTVYPLRAAELYANEPAIWEWEHQAIIVYEGVRQDGRLRCYVSERQVEHMFSKALLALPSLTDPFTDCDLPTLLPSLHKCAIAGSHPRDLKYAPAGRMCRSQLDLREVDKINRRGKRGKNKNKKKKKKSNSAPIATPDTGIASDFNYSLRADGPLFVVCHDDRLEKHILCDALGVLPVEDYNVRDGGSGPHQPNFVSYVDTQVVYFGMAAQDAFLRYKSSLLKMARALRIDATLEAWHNAGNDAKWTLDALELILCAQGHVNDE